MTKHWPVSLLSSASAIINMFIPLLMVRLLIQDQVGLFRIFFLYVMLMPSFSFTAGLQSGLAYWAGQGERGMLAIRLSNGMTLLAGLLLSLLCLAFVPWISRSLHWPMSYGVYFSLTVLGTVSLSFLEESAIVKGRIWFGAVYTSGMESFRTIMILFVTWLTRDIGTILFACAGLAVGKLLISIWLARRHGYLAGFRESYQAPRSLYKDIWTFALPVSLAGLVGVFLSTGDQFVLSTLVTPAAFAIYSVGCLVIPPLNILEQSITRVMIPHLSQDFSAQDFSEGNHTRAAEHYRASVEQLAWLIIPAVAGLIIFSRPIIEMLFTARYSASVIFCRWFALSYLFLIFPHDALPRARGEGRWIMKTSIAFSVISLAFCYLFGHLVNVQSAGLGVLAGLLISRGSLKLYSLAYVRSSTGWRFGEFIPFGKLLLFALASILLSVLCLALKHSLGGGLRWFLICAPVFIILYFPIVFFFTNLFQRMVFSKRNGNNSTKGNVLLFSQHLSVGGLERMVLSLGQGLKRTTAWGVFVFSHDCDETAENHTDRTLISDFLSSGIPVEAFKKGSHFSLMTLYRLLRNIFRNNIDVIHSHDIGPLIYSVLAKYLSFGRVKLIHTQHSFVHFLPSAKNPCYPFYEGIFTRFVDELTVVNDSLIQSYVAIGVPEHLINIVNNGVSFFESPIRSYTEKQLKRTALLEHLSEPEWALIAPFIGRPAEKTYWILYLARFQSIKGQREAVDLWSHLSASLRRNSVLLMIGPEAEEGEKKEVLRRFEHAPNRDRVIFLNGTRFPQAWIASSDLFLSCSQIEGMPLGPLEAIGSGIPAVLSAIKGHGFLEKYSYQFRLGEPAIGALMIEKLLTEPAFGTSEYYKQLWEKTCSIRDQYSATAMTKQYVNFYSRMVMTHEE